MRWLLHTRRVPLREQHATDQTKQDARQAGAGTAEYSESELNGTTGDAPQPAIGDLNKDSWLCKDCVFALCVKHPKMPPLALANDLRGGRLHPLYRNLNLATNAALSPGRAMIRPFLLREPGEDKDTMQKGFSGNIVLNAQPSSTQIFKALPP